MAVTKDQLLIEITANTRGAASGIKDVTDKLGDMQGRLASVATSNKRTEDSLNGLGATFIKLNAATQVAKTAFDVIARTMQKTVGEFAKSRDGVQELANTLALMGEKNVTGSLEKFLKLAGDIKDTTVVDDDTVVTMAQLGVAAGRTDKQIEQMIKTAVNMSAINKSAPTANMEALLATYKGMGKSLETLTPEIRNLTDAQMMAGGAVDLLEKKFAGFAEAANTTFTGTLKNLEKNTNDVMKEIGHIFEVGFDVSGAVTSFNESMKELLSSLAENGAAISAIIAEIKQAFMNFVNGVIVAFGFLEVGFGQIGKFIAGIKGDFLGMTAGEFDKVQDDILTRNEQLMSSMKLSATAGEEAFKKYGTAIKETVKIADNGGRKEVVVITEESKAALKDLHDKMLAYQQQSAAAGKSDYEQIQLKAKADLDGLKIIERKLIAQKALTDAGKADLELARRAIAERAAAEKAENSRKVLQQASDKTRALQDQVKAQNQTALGQAQAQRQRELDDVERQRQEYIRQGRMSAGGMQTAEGAKLGNELKLQESAINSKQLLGHNDAFNQAKDVGDSIAMSMGKAMDGAAMGFMAGATSVIGQAQGVIDMAQGLVDAIPKLLFSFAHLLDSIVDLPNQIAAGIDKVLTSVLNVIANLIPNLLKAVSTIIESVIKFIMNLPQAIAGLFDQVGTILLKFADNLPDMAERLVLGIVSGVPKIVAKLTEFLIVKAPEIAWKLAYALSIELPPAIIHGIAEGLKEFGRIWQRWMKGQFSGGIDMKIDTEKMKKQLAQITNDTAKLFSVTSIEKAAKNAESEVRKIEEGARKAGKDMWKYFVQAMVDGASWLGDAGTKIWNGLKTAAAFIGEFGTAIWNGLVTAVGDIAKTFGEWGTKIWNGVTDAIGKLADTFGKWGTAIWDGVTGAIGKLADTFGVWGKAIWDGFLAPIGETFKGFGKSIVDGFTGAWNGLTSLINTFFNGLGESFQRLFKLDLSGVKTAIEGAFTGAGEILKGAFRGVMNPLIEILNGVIAALNGLKIPALNYDINYGIGRAKGQLIGETDLIPGEIGTIAKFASGGYVGGMGSGDVIPAMLTPGEFVMNKGAVGTIGLSNLIAMNGGKQPSGMTTQNIAITLNIESKDRIDENFVRQRIMPTLREELKRGSLDGRAVVYSGGVRK